MFFVFHVTEGAWRDLQELTWTLKTTGAGTEEGNTESLFLGSHVG